MRNLLIFPLLIASQFFCSIIVNSMSYDTLGSFKHILRHRSWERGGSIYQKVFKIRAWKDYVPEMGRITPEKFSKRHVMSTKAEYLEQFILESVRAELCHCFSLFLSIPILTFVDTPFFKWALVYVIFLNAPCIMIQRTNRPRLERILQHSIRCTETTEVIHEDIQQNKTKC
ncbi:MAG: hypothetical protein SO135_03700 [Sphaerochaetaceae bacterium]|nr:hypothetical protein [Sphaerochaetaceae bacterium]